MFDGIAEHELENAISFNEIPICFYCFFIIYFYLTI